MAQPNATEPLVCPSCRKMFLREHGFLLKHRILITPLCCCSTDCVLDSRERLEGRDPRRRWPPIPARMWRGKEIPWRTN
jgi:hypothetical protein